MKSGYIVALRLGFSDLVTEMCACYDVKNGGQYRCAEADRGVGRTDLATTVIRRFGVCLALACFTGIASARPEPLMGLVAPGVGWALRGCSVQSDCLLLWTNDDGAHWTDITPHDPSSREIAGVSFLDASRGWVLFAVRDEESSDQTGFNLASTTNGGASWTVRRLTPPPSDTNVLYPYGEIFFLDAADGWMNLVTGLLATTDGGKTWNPIVEVNGGGEYGPLRFTDPQNGWIAGGADDQHLCVTHDGGRHWKEVVLRAPSSISRLFSTMKAQYTLPAFKDSKRGFLPVTYSGLDKSGDGLRAISVLALFSTSDGGHAWKVESWVKLGEERAVPVVAAVDSEAITPKFSSHKPLILIKLGPAGKVAETVPTQVPTTATLDDFMFTDTTHGWAVTIDSGPTPLFSTADGGVTWRDITPIRKKASTPVPSNTKPKNDSSENSR